VQEKRVGTTRGSYDAGGAKGRRASETLIIATIIPKRERERESVCVCLCVQQGVGKRYLLQQHVASVGGASSSSTMTTSTTLAHVGHEGFCSSHACLRNCH
jgi:hypothetical protein